eukprot:42619-Prymnesium_polylepis.1
MGTGEGAASAVEAEVDGGEEGVADAAVAHGDERRHPAAAARERWFSEYVAPVSYTHLRAHETLMNL